MAVEITSLVLHIRHPLHHMTYFTISFYYLSITACLLLISLYCFFVLIFHFTKVYDKQELTKLKLGHGFQLVLPGVDFGTDDLEAGALGVGSFGDFCGGILLFDALLGF